MKKNSSINETKKKIKDAFIRLYFEKDIMNITVKNICSEVPISRTNFYNYYDNVYSVYEDIEGDVLSDLDKITIDFSESDFSDNHTENLHGISEVLDYMQKNSIYMRALIRHGGTSGFTYKWKKQIKDKFNKKYAKEMSHKAERSVYLEFTVAGITGVCEYWLYHPDKFSKKDVIDGVYNMVCHEKRE